MTAITPHRVRKVCLLIRQHTDNLTADIKYWLDELDNLKETGWSPDALPMIQLASDAVALRALAEAIETTRFGLIHQQEKMK